MSRSLRAAAAAVVLIVPVGLEITWPPFGDHALGLEIFAVSQIAGWLLVLSVCGQAAAPPPGSRARVGRKFVMIGCWFQVAFGLVYAVTAIDGEPLEAVFVAFLLGFLALLAGGLTWGIPLARTAAGRTAGWGLVATAGLGFLAMVFGGDPWHDVFLLSSYAAWGVVGRGFDIQAAHESSHSRGPVVTHPGGLDRLDHPGR